MENEPQIPEKQEHQGRNPNTLYAGLVMAGTVAFLFGIVTWFFLEGKPQGTWVYGVFGIAGALVVLALLFALKLSRQKTPHEPDYYAFFTMGIVWTGAGIAIGLWGLTVLGLIFMAVGIVHKDKWKQTKWADLPPRRRHVKLASVAVIGALMLAAIVYSFLR